MFEAGHSEWQATDAPPGALHAGYGYCRRCASEGCPNPCFAFLGIGAEPSMSTPCQRNWCGHSFSDHG